MRRLALEPASACGVQRAEQAIIAPTMALTQGTKLGPYEVHSPLGSGGMGEVYRARDTRLGRDVAIKVLPAHLSSNPDLRQRMEREARAISSLNHPHICTLHDVGSQDGVDFLVMERLEGETLADRLHRGALPLDEALKIAIQIADALDKAHARGIVHRDLKPANIMLTKNGPKLMDFGLAKPAPGLSSGPGASPSTPSTPTMSVAALSGSASPLTQKGTVVGTFQYMAPEVLQGVEADARSDVFSFGCVIFEMVTGRRAFEGKSQFSVLGAILDREPERVSVQCGRVRRHGWTKQWGVAWRRIRISVTAACTMSGFNSKPWRKLACSLGRQLGRNRFSPLRRYRGWWP